MAITPTPGAPAVILPVYQAPAFTTPSVTLGSTVTTVTFEDVNGITPFTFGQVFKIGEMAPTDGLTGRIAGVADIALQMDVKATHPDGSIRHAIISGITKVSGEMHLIRSAVKVAVSHSVVTKGVDIRIVEAGVEYHAYNKIDDNKWINGDIAVEYVGFEKLVTPEGVEHPFLTVQINERVYANGQAKFDVVVEHTKAYQATTDITYDIEISSDSQVMYSKTGLVHFPCTRYKRTFWQGGKPSIHIKHNVPYLIATKAVPNYDQSVVMTEATLASYEKYLTQFSFEPMAWGRFQPGMSAPGGRPDIGLAPDCYAATILSMDKRAKALMLASADVGGHWGAHRRLPDDTLLDVIRYPRATIAGTTMDSINPLTKLPEKLPTIITTSKLAHDSAHQPQFAYIPYLLTGDYFYLEELQFWCHYNTYAGNPAYRGFEKGLFKTDQLRGQAWSIRTLAEAEYITPDNHQHKTAYKYWLDANMEFYRVNYTDGSYTAVKNTNMLSKETYVDPYFYNDLGACFNGPTMAYAVKGVAGTGMAPWMDDFMTQAIGHAADLGHKEAARFLKWKAKFQVGRTIADGYCPRDAAVYAMRVRESGVKDPTTGAFPPIYKTLKQCWENTMTVLVCDPSAPMTGYPTSTEGFPSNYQPALAAAVDSGYEGADKAWELFINREVKPNYGTAPQFAIVPRKSTEVIVVTPPEPVEPPPVVPPVIVEPPPVIVVPPVVEPPPVIPVEPDAKVVITNPCLVSLQGLTVILESGVRTKVYTNQTGNAAGEVVITDKMLLVGAAYTATIIDDLGYTIAKIFPIQVN